MNRCFSLPGTRSTHACSSFPGIGCFGLSTSITCNGSGGSSTWSTFRSNNTVMGTGWVSVQEQADKKKRECRVSGSSGRDVRAQDLRPSTQVKSQAQKPLIGRSLELVPQQQQQQQQLEEVQLPQQVPLQEEHASHHVLQKMAHEVFGKEFSKLTLRERQSVSRILSSQQRNAQAKQKEVNASPKPSHVEAEREAAAQELFGRSWSELTTREKQSLAAKLLHARQHAGSKRAQDRAILQQKNSLALAHYGKPFSELDLRDKHLLGRLWNKESIFMQGRAAVFPPGTSSKEQEEQLQQQRLQYLKQQRQQQQEREEYEVLWRQERDALSWQHFGKGWEELPEQARHSVRALMAHRHQRQTLLPDGLKAQDAFKMQQLQAIAAERFGKGYDALSLEEKRFVVQIWRWCNPLEMSGTLEEVEEQPHLKKRDGNQQHQQQQQRAKGVEEKEQQQQQQQQQQLPRDNDQKRRDQEEVALAVLGRPWNSLEIRERQMISAHLMHARKRDKDNPALDDGQDRLAAVKDHIRQVLAEQQQDLEVRESLAMQWFGKPWDSLASSERKSVRGRMARARTDKERLGKAPGPSAMPGQEPVRIQGAQTLAPAGVSWDQLSRQHSLSLPLAEAQQQQQQQQEKEEVAVSILGQPWESLALGERRMISAHLSYARKRVKDGVFAPENKRDWLEAVKDHIRQALAEQQEVQRRRESVALQWLGKPWDSLTPSDKASASARMGKLDSPSTKKSSKKPESPPDPEADRDREMLAQLFYSTTWDKLSNQQRRSITARLPLVTPEYIQQQREKMQRQQAKEAEAERMYGQAWRDLSNSQRRSVSTYLAWAASKGQEAPLGKEHAVQGATPSTAVAATTITAGTDSAAPVQVRQTPEPLPGAALARKGRGRPRKPTTPPALGAGHTTMPSAPSSAPTDATHTTTPLTAVASTSQDSSMPSAQESGLLKSDSTAASTKTRRARTRRPKPALTTDGVPTKADTPELHGATMPSGPTTPFPTPEAQTAEPVAAAARKRTRASPPTPSPSPQYTTAAGTVTTAPDGARPKRGKRVQGEDDHKVDGGGANAPQIPQPIDIPAMLQRLKEMQGLGAKIRQVLDRLEGSRAQYERLPPECAQEKQRYFESLKSAQASLDEIAKLEHQILAGIQQSRESNGR